MASKIKVDQIEGSSGSSITIPSGQTLSIADGLSSSSLPTVPVSKGGTGLTSLGTANQELRVNSGGTALEFHTPSGGETQVKQTIKTDVQSFSANTSRSDITGLNLSLTPSSTSNKVWYGLMLIIGETIVIAKLKEVLVVVLILLFRHQQVMVAEHQLTLVVLKILMN